MQTGKKAIGTIGFFSFLSPFLVVGCKLPISIKYCTSSIAMDFAQKIHKLRILTANRGNLLPDL
jgi:hypothetical protein